MHTVVAARGDPRLGFYRLAGEAPVAELADLFVDLMAIGRGVGATLLADAVDRARALGVSRLVIDADPHAAGVYVRMGARRVGSVASSSSVCRELPNFDSSWTPREADLRHRGQRRETDSLIARGA